MAPGNPGAIVLYLNEEGVKVIFLVRASKNLLTVW